MDSITMNFPKALNVSVQVGDTAYYTDDVNGKVLKNIGLVTAIGANYVTSEISPSQPRPSLTSFILFSKTASVNTGNLKGYYADMQYKNDSESYAELFLVGSEIFESSK
jgi:hypothetical protein